MMPLSPWETKAVKHSRLQYIMDTFQMRHQRKRSPLSRRRAAEGSESASLTDSVPALENSNINYFLQKLEERVNSTNTVRHRRTADKRDSQNNAYENRRMNQRQPRPPNANSTVWLEMQKWLNELDAASSPRAENHPEIFSSGRFRGSRLRAHACRSMQPLHQ